MLERINGFSEDSVLGYFQGKNALASIAIDTTGDIALVVTGAVCSFVGLQHFLNTQNNDEIVAFLNAKGVVRVDGSQFVEATVQADYTEAYAAQTNLKRVVDVVQQRAVIIATSDIAKAASVAGFKNVVNGVDAAATIASADVITFLVERADVFDRDATSFQGVPSTTIDAGRLLLDDLAGVPLMDKTGAEVILEGASSAKAGNFAIKIYKSIPALLD